MSRLYEHCRVPVGWLSNSPSRRHRRLALGDDWSDGGLRKRRPSGEPGDDKDYCNDGDAPH
ncbi:MAG: hypothetical protein E5W53_20510 [Mesorhizobium sp.]|nr:MAG: hypothetical protein E5W53_20510 [Mesorhizobium sp.]TIY03272.1 MAG: hypothetical protein E5V16_25040 [Mesorhizobium sp.]